MILVLVLRLWFGIFYVVCISGLGEDNYLLNLGKIKGKYYKMEEMKRQCRLLLDGFVGLISKIKVIEGIIKENQLNYYILFNRSLEEFF